MEVRFKRALSFCFVLVLMMAGTNAWSAPYTWYWDSNWNEPHAKHATPAAACENFIGYVAGNNGLPDLYKIKFEFLKNVTEGSFIKYDCHYYTLWKPHGTSEWIPFNGGGGTLIFREGDSCPEGQILNAESHSCELTSSSIPERQLGNVNSPSCATESSASGSPGLLINAAIGNVHETEVDYSGPDISPISFVRHFNSNNGVWNQTYSTRLAFDSSSVTLIDESGKHTTFVFNDGATVVDLGDLGKLQKPGVNWIYTSAANETMEFSVQGLIVGKKAANGVTLNINYGPLSNATPVTVTDSLGNSFWFIQDAAFFPRELHAAGLDVTYAYNASGQIYRVDRSRNGQVESRTYLYEIPGKPNLLTGIVDERGVRTATWAYDDQNRVISSEQANATGKVLVAYNPDGSSTVTNELGKQTTYRYQVIQGVKRITAVEGEPSANCPASNSTYTYNEHGQVQAKTDAKGFVTTHVYNDRGLQTSRTEATGTPQARTTTTTWHTTFNLPLTVTEGGQVTTYTYDAQGRQTSRTKMEL